MERKYGVHPDPPDDAGGDVVGREGAALFRRVSYGKCGAFCEEKSGKSKAFLEDKSGERGVFGGKNGKCGISREV